MQTLNLDTKPGPFQTQWAQAFNDYASSSAGHWHKTLQEFQQLATNYPQFKAVAPYLNYAKAQASSEKVAATPTPQTKGATNTPQSGAWQALALTGAALLGLLVLVALLFGVGKWQRKKQVKGGKAGAAGVPGASASAQRVAPAANMQARPAQAGAAPPVRGPRTPSPAAAGKAAHEDDLGDMTAFGAPPKRGTSQTPVPTTPSLPTTPQGTISLRVWPCGHMNRPNARFCTICGEPAPEPPTIIIKRIEQ